MNRLENIHVKDYYWKNTVLIDATEVGITEFDITKEKKMELIERGYKATEKYLFDKNNL